MNFLKQNYTAISHFILNGSYAYALYGVYAVTISPLLIEVMEKHKPTLFIAVFGFVMLIAEFFALNFKLKMVRIRAHEKQLLLKKQTGQSILPSVTPIVLFCFCIRLVFRIGIVMAIMTALGFDCNTSTMSVPGEIAIMSALIFDIVGFAYIYLKRDIYTDVPKTEREFKEEIKEDEKWYDLNVKSIASLPYVKLEMLSDFILQIYSLMLFSSFWRFINQEAINRLHNEIIQDFFALPPEMIKTIQSSSKLNLANSYVTTGSGLGIVLLLFVTVMLGLIPLRLAYWAEDSMSAFTKKERKVMWTIFAVVALYTCSPFLAEYVAMTKFDAPPNSVPEWIQYAIATSFFLTLLLLHIVWVKTDVTLENET